MIMPVTNPAAIEIAPEPAAHVTDRQQEVRLINTPQRCPSVLQREQFVETWAELRQEHCPAGPTECALVRELARVATAMNRWGLAAESIERHASANLTDLTESSRIPGNDMDDALLVVAMAPDSSYRAETMSLSFIREFQRLLARLTDTQRRRMARTTGHVVEMPPDFADELACEAYLVARLRRGLQKCLSCGGADGYYLAARKTWECSGCHAQRGLRTGTVMARSAIPLMAWFNTINQLLHNPTISAADLATALKVNRLATVRTMVAKIHTAMAADNCSEQLAALDVYFAASRPASSVSGENLSEIAQVPPSNFSARITC